jgi:hypothetical protein
VTKASLIAFTFLLIGAAACASSRWSESQKRVETPQVALSSIVKLLEAGKVQSVEVTYEPIEIEHREDLTPERLRTLCMYKVIIRRFGESAESAPLISALKGTRLQGSRFAGDLRWSLVFKFENQDSREICLDGFGRLGRIDDASTTFQGSLYEWLRQLTGFLK